MQDKYLKFRINDKYMDELQKISEKTGLTVTSCARCLIIKALDDFKTSNNDIVDTFLK